MIILPKKCNCHDCEANPRVMQKDKSEKGEHWFCDQYKKIPEDILRGLECKNMIKDE